MAGRGLLLAAVLMIAACDDGEGANNAVAPASNNAAVAQNNVVAAADAGPALVLEGEGLRLIDPVTTHATPIPFGTDKAMALRAISAGMKGAPDTQTSNSECGEGPLEMASWNKGLSVYFQDGKFVGWGGAVDLKTMNGIGFGSTRAQLDAAFSPTVEESSLGTEFHAAGLSGILESTAKDAAISEIWAGMTCIAR